MRTDGTGFRKLTDDPHRDREPKWSPDGKTIAFHSDRSGTFQIWTINADGSGLRQLTDSAITITSSHLVAGRNPNGRPDSSARPRGQTRALVFDVRKPWSEQTPEALPFSLPDGVTFAAALVVGRWAAAGADRVRPRPVCRHLHL